MPSHTLSRRDAKHANPDGDRPGHRSSGRSAPARRVCEDRHTAIGNDAGDRDVLVTVGCDDDGAHHDPGAHPDLDGAAAG